MFSKAMKILALIAVLLAIRGSLPGSLGQEESPDEDAIDNTAILDEDDELANLIRGADRKAAGGDWESASALYQEALEMALDKASSAMCPVKVSHEEKAILYINAIDYCRERLLRMNARALATYQANYEVVAALLLKEALKKADFDMLLDVGERYPCAESALRALTLAADVAAERGDYLVAAMCYRKVLAARAAWPPAATASRKEYAVLVAKAARAFGALGWKSEVIRLKGLLSRDRGISSLEIIFSGKRVTLLNFLDGMIESCKPRKTEPVSDYPTFGGNASRGMMMPDLSEELGGVRWRWKIKHEDNRHLPRWWKRRPYLLPSFLLPTPTAKNGTLFISTGRYLQALRESDGGNAYTFSAGAGTGARWRTYQSAAASAEFCTVHDGIAYFVMPARVRVGKNNVDVRILYALDASTGKVKWNSLRDTGLQYSEEISSAPVGRGDDVLFQTWIDSGWQTNFYLLCVDAKTGNLKWRCNIAESVVAGIRRSIVGGRMPPSDVVALDGNSAIVSSYSGAIASVDIHTGRLNWIVKHHQDVINMFIQWRRQGETTDTRMWRFNSPITRNGRVFVARPDSTRLYCLNVETGDVEWARQLPDLCYLAGVDDGKLFIVDKTVMVLDAATGEPFYTGKDEIVLPVGRPALTKSALYISTADMLLRFDRKTKTLEEVFKWKEYDMRPGNLLVTESGLYVVNSEEVVAFYDMRVLDEIGELLKRTPDAPLLLYRRGKVLLAGKRFEEAVSDFRKASEKATPEHRIFGRPLRALVGDGLCASYMGLSARHDREGNMEDAVRCARLGLKHAATDRARLDASTAIARLYEKGPDEESWRSAVNFYQQIISNYPEQMYERDNCLEQSAACHAAERIRAIIKARGRRAYSSVEAEAAKLLAEVEKPPAASGYLKVYCGYPNSIAALKSLMHLAVVHEKNGRKAMALAVLKALSRNFEDGTEIAPALLNLQRVAWECGDYVSARRALERMAKLPPGLTVEPESGKRSAVDYAKERLAELDKVMPSAEGKASFNGKAEKVAIIMLGGKAAAASRERNVLLETEGTPPPDMAGKLLTTRGGVLYCWDLESGKLVWSNHSRKAWLGVSLDFADNKAVIRSVDAGHGAKKAGIRKGDRILSLNGVQARSLRDFRDVLSSLRPGDKVKVVYSRNDKKKEVDVTLTEVPSRHANLIYKVWYNGATSLIVGGLYGNSEFRCVNIKTGETVWRANIPAAAWKRRGVGLVFRNGIFAYLDASARRQRLVMLDLSTGKIAASFPLGRNFKGEIELVGDNCVVLDYSTRLCRVFDMLTGRERFRIKTAASPPSLAKRCAGAGDRLLALVDNDERFRVLDLQTGADIHGGEGVQFIQFAAMTSDRYMIVYSRLRGNVLVFDILAGSALPPIAVNIRNHSPAILGGRIFFSGGNLLHAYDASTGKALWQAKISDGRVYSLRPPVVSGNHIVLCYRQAADSKKQLHLKVFDVLTGREVRHHREPLIDSGRVEFVVRDGRLCVMQGNRVTVLK